MSVGRFGAALALTVAAACGLRAQQAVRPPPSGAAPSLIRYYISEGKPGSGYRSSDRELAEWAFAAWERNSSHTIALRPAREQDAAVRVYWAPANGSTYGETRPTLVNGQPGAEVFVMADTDGLGADIGGRAQADPLWRDTIVYLTCVHELGHALGLKHTADDRDIMYFFGYGGDIVEYFARYRRQLHQRDDIRSVSGLSPADVRALLAVHRAG